MKKILGLLLALGMVASVAAKVNFPYPQAKAYKYGIYQSGVSDNVKQRFLSFYNALYKESSDGKFARIGFDDVNYTVSEGIGYGMIMLVYFSDNTTSYQSQFDKLWAYYNKFLNDNGLMHWKINGFSGVAEQNGATDADEDVAFALAMAYYQFGDEKYKTAAESLIAKIRSYEFETSGLHRPGDAWNSERNPSYVSPAEYEVFKSFDDADFWSSAISANYTLLKKNQNSSSGLPTDWSDDNGNPGRAGEYGYDAARAPWRWAWSYAWYGHGDANALLSKLAPWVNGKNSASDLKIPMNANGSGGQHSNSTAVGPLTCALMYSNSYATKLSSFTTSLLNNSGEAYFSAAMQVLTGLLISGNMQNFAEMATSNSSSSAGGSATSSSSFSSSSQAAGTTSVIDDFADGDNQANNLGEAYWYIYVTGGASVSNTKTGDTWNMVASSGSDYYAAMTSISGVISGSSKYPGAGISLDVPENSLANCTAITYKYKGSGHKFRAGISTVTADKGYEHVTDVYDASTGWTSVTVTASDLAQPDPEGYWIPASEKQTFSWALVEKMAWVVDEKLSNEQIGTELDIDDVTCVGTLPVVESSSSGTSSSSVGGTSSSSVGGSSASVGAPGVIDDVEDGDGQAFSGGYWFAYTDKGDKGASIIGNDTDTDGGYVMVADGSNGTNYVVGMNGIQLNKGGNENDPYVAMGLNLTLENMASNLSTCTEISYDYKGAAHNFKVVMAGDPKGELTGYDRHFVVVEASTGWTTATISWSDLKQNGWGKSVTLDKTKVSAFHWEVKGSASVNYLYVDNFTCVGLNVADIALSSSSSATNPNSSSSYNPYNPYSSSSYNPYNPYSSSAYNPYNPYDPYGIAESQLHSGLKVSMAGSVLNVTVERAGLVKVHVFDMMGHAIESHVENMAAGTYGHSLANLSKGAYIVRVQQGSEQKVIRTQVR